MIQADIASFKDRTPAEPGIVGMVTFTRWANYLKAQGIQPGDPTLVQFPDSPLSVGYTSKRQIVLFYAEVPIIEHYGDVTTRFTVDPAAARQYEDSLDVINQYTPDWFKVRFDGAAYWVDITIDGETRRYGVYYQGKPKVWRRSKLGVKHRRTPTPQLPTPDNPVSLDTSRNWVALARINKTDWESEDLQYLESVMIDAGTVIREADLLLAPIRALQETLLQVSAERRGQGNT